MSSSVMLTGATGFIGSHIADKLLSDGIYRLVTTSREPVGYKNTRELSDRGVMVYTGSFFKYDLIDRIIRENKISAIVHCAAIRGGGVASINAYNEINVRGTEVLLEAALHNAVEIFIFISSVGVYGTIPGVIPPTANSGLVGDNLYHSSKIAAENAVRRYAAKGLRTIILRPTITYGKGDTGFPATLCDLVRKRILLLPMRRVLIHLLDVKSIARLVANIINQNLFLTGSYIVADESPVELGKLVNSIHREIYGKPYPAFMQIPDIIFDIMTVASSSLGNEKWTTRFKLVSRSWYYDISDTIRTFDFKPSKTLDSFIETML